MVVGLDHESSDASEGPGAVCLLFPSKQVWRDHHSGIYRNRTHERARVQLFKAIPVAGLFTPELEDPTKGLERRFARSVVGRKSCVEMQETKVCGDHSCSATSLREAWRCLAWRTTLPGHT